ncbi:helicase-related protein [Bacteroidetes bacterium endosymbiont of Geopemphigus sp.]
MPDFPCRKKKEENWYNNFINILLATSAFSMGIDKTNVELAVHWELPTFIESYFQEIGHVPDVMVKRLWESTFVPSSRSDKDSRLYVTRTPL